MIRLIDIQNENPAITDLSGPCGPGNYFNNVVNPSLVGDNFDHRLGQQRYLVLLTAVNSGLSFLMTMPADVGNRKARCHALDARNQIAKLLRPDNALDQFHGRIVSLAQVRKKTNVTRMNNGIRMTAEYSMYRTNDGTWMPCLSAMLFTMKFGPLPM